MRTAIAATVAALAATVLLLGGILRPANGEARSAVPMRVTPPGTATEAELRKLRARVRAQPRDAERLALLGLAYEERARETADQTYLTKAERVLDEALRLAPRNANATIGAASLALTRHEFRRALALGRRARLLVPKAAEPHAIIGDSLVELGRPHEGFRHFDLMVREAPGVASYARVAYGRELLGNRRGAFQAMRLAVDAAAGDAEPTAWTNVQLGKLYLGSGMLAPAIRHYRIALRALPGYPLALDALARAEASRGRHDRAVALARRAIAAAELPEFVTTLADALAAAGRWREAREQDVRVVAVERLLRENGARPELETVEYYVDRGIKLRYALSLARRAHAGQPSLDGDDILAWALVRNGRCREALHYSKRALRLGTRDAMKYFRRGMIERCFGRDADARSWFRRALELNPYFSLRWAPVARDLAGERTGSG